MSFVDCCVPFGQLPRIDPLPASAVFFRLTFPSWNVRWLCSLWPCCQDRTSTFTLLVNPFWQAASSCHNQDLLAVSLFRLSPWCKKHSVPCGLGELQRMPPRWLEWPWSTCVGAAQPPPETHWHGYHIFPSKSQYNMVEVTLILIWAF